ncbi:DUF4184 family protein [Arcticibacterium luteifluviistationis]|uniref:DUF4184 domain-containing protein n=1 Tax=Arcticibacterium luteifluviistationis TaxID=1784714 RepID=A0A2Z4GCS2_9BACT|nr:DUF4184 family protein [Arcticibacterium luteifluviistationis]AWV99099.1 hypothetical protein DJ013_13350 [Arcticibacterium luteifluviistationis]
MPFTLAHTAAILPFRRFFSKYFSISGLIMGSMAPDFEFFLRVTLYGIWGHTWWGVLFFNLPVSIILCLYFHIYVKKSLIDHLPPFLYQRLAKYKNLDWYIYFKKNWLKVILSILVGVLTHFIWDNFTHEPNYIFPFYLDILSSVFLLNEKPLAVYTVLQILSSIIGMLYFFYFMAKMPKEEGLNALAYTKRKRYWIWVSIVFCLVIIVRYAIGVPDEKPIGQIIVVSVSASLISISLISQLFKNEQT